MRIITQIVCCFLCIAIIGCSSSKKETQKEIKIGGESVKQADGSTFTPASVETYESVPKELPGRSTMGSVKTKNPKTGKIENGLSPKDKILAAVHGSKGALFIDQFDIEQNKVYINYSNDINKAKKEGVDFRGTVEEYWKAGNYWKKHLIILPAQIFMSDISKNEVIIDFPLSNRNYEVNVSRTDFEQFTGMKFGKDPEGAINTFYNKFIFDESKRNNLFKQFVKTK